MDLYLYLGKNRQGYCGLFLKGGLIMNANQETPDKQQIIKTYAEIRIMINHFIQLGYHKEVAFWRRVLQAAKVYIRGMGHS